MKKVVLILIDAFRSDYLTKENTPFLFECSQQGTYYKEVEQSRSFCERGEIFTGLSPKESGYFTAIGYDPETSPFRKLKWLDKLSFIEVMIPKNKIYRVYKRFLNKYLKAKGNGMSSYSIPLNFLKYFNLTEDKYDFRSDLAFEGKDNIFSVCKNKNINIYYDSFTALNFTKPGDDTSRMKDALANINNDYSLYLVYQAIIDSLGHTYGPDSNDLVKGIKKVDSEIKLFCENIQAQQPDTTFIILGDHGMSKITDVINIELKIKEFAAQYELKVEKDFIYFLDSTIFRVWYFSEKAKQIFEQYFKLDNEMCKKGIFVDTQIAESEDIPYGDSRYGDMLWMSNLGVLIYPDFFHRSKQYKGMHGYTTDDKSSKGTCIVYSAAKKENNVVEKIKLTAIYNIMKNELGIEK